MSNTETWARCRECSRAYQLIELPFGAGADEIKRAQRELAKSLHPDVWGQRHGAGFAEEQLKRINSACDHLAQCRWSQWQHSGGTSANEHSSSSGRANSENGWHDEPPGVVEEDPNLSETQPIADPEENQRQNTVSDAGRQQTFLRVTRVLFRACNKTCPTAV